MMLPNRLKVVSVIWWWYPMVCILVVAVSAASLPEREGAKLLFDQLHGLRDRFHRLIKIWVDGGYRGEGFMRWVMDVYGWIQEP
ncbi:MULTISPECIES: hypothetical protein [unclassified Moorena]|uniref:hypothetical protein n=1 Tax=unclassified Moorena TaxID=2683338 RepID=UPI0013BF1EF1|nr:MULTISPECIES: hypothetical protein [unclassified Moorena]NEO05516.1 hypothetical protein [Moorena sp. SIO3I8]NEP24136.1 hypothetical protein [Moorena sp. SIO3I6]